MRGSRLVVVYSTAPAQLIEDYELMLLNPTRSETDRVASETVKLVHWIRVGALWRFNTDDVGVYG